MMNKPLDIPLGHRSRAFDKRDIGYIEAMIRYYQSCLTFLKNEVERIRRGDEYMNLRESYSFSEIPKPPTRQEDLIPWLNKYYILRSEHEQLLSDTVNKVLDKAKKSIKNKIASRASSDFYHHDKLGKYPPKQTNSIATGNTDWIIEDTIEQVREGWK